MASPDLLHSSIQLASGIGDVGMGLLMAALFIDYSGYTIAEARNDGLEKDLTSVDEETGEEELAECCENPETCPHWEINVIPGKWRKRLAYLMTLSWILMLLGIGAEWILKLFL